jgi:hypothetical protein
VADHPLRSATRRRLGRLLPHQLPDRPQAPPKAHCCFTSCEDYAVLATISRGYSPLQGRLPTCYAPVRHSPEGACDLHVLSMPPMFILSQDQTLHESLTHFPRRRRFNHSDGSPFWVLHVSITLLLVKFARLVSVSLSAGLRTIHRLKLYVKFAFVVLNRVSAF